MKEQIINNWDKILNILETHYDVSHIIVDTWIKPLSIYDIHDDTIYFCVDERRGKHGVDYLRIKDMICSFFLLLENSSMILTSNS